jgi:hypothetical protein
MRFRFIAKIKDSAYYPVGHEKMDRAAFELRERGWRYSKAVHLFRS